MEKIISIITVTFNCHTTLQNTLSSIRKNKNEQIEFLVIDGDSKDGTLSLIKENEDIIDYWISEKDRGIYDAMNKGLKKATGKYIIYMNSDDWFFENSLNKALPTLANSEADIVYGSTYIYCDGKLVGERLPDNPTPGKVPYRMPFSHQSCFIKRSKMNSLSGFDLSYKVVADLNLIATILKDKDCILLKLNFPISCFSTGGASSNISLSAQERFSIHLKHGLSLPVASTLYLKWILIGLLKKMSSKSIEFKLRKIKTKLKI